MIVLDPNCRAEQAVGELGGEAGKKMLKTAKALQDGKSLKDIAYDE